VITGVIAITAFFVAHWALSVFGQSFYLHRYAAHRMFTMSRGWERFFHLFTYAMQGSSCLDPRGYAILHREHHAYSDTEKDPHSPLFYRDVGRMMWATKARYFGLARRRIRCEERFEGGVPEWPAVDRFADSWLSRIGWGAAYTLFYVAFAPHWAFFLLLPIHWVMGPVHGAIVNWCGHKYGYRNFDHTGDASKNTLAVDVLMGGELFQNNHHARPASPTFAQRWFEIDPVFLVMRALHAVGVIELVHPKYRRSAPALMGGTGRTPSTPRSPASQAGCT
jgi:stearoyl-CoA desaturase (delta-9 desaturase)